jgi:hypothetical protein
MLSEYKTRAPIVKTDAIAITESTTLERRREGSVGVAKSTRIKIQIMPNKIISPVAP